MAATGRKLTAAVEEYLAELRRIRATGGGTGELSYSPPLNNLLNAVGGSLRPRVYCVSQLAQQGAGHPDFGLYAARQVTKGQPKQGQLPEGGVVEVKPASDDACMTPLVGLILRDVVLTCDEANRLLASLLNSAGTPAGATRLGKWRSRN